MVAFIDLAPVPTVNVLLAVPVSWGAGGWSWGELPRLGTVLAREYVYDAAECASVVNTYGTMMSRMIRTCEADRFCITVRGRVTGLILRRAEWVWDDHAHTYAAHGEPLDGWRVAARAYWEATGQLIGAQRFERSGRLPIVRDAVKLDARRNRLASSLLNRAAA